MSIMSILYALFIMPLQLAFEEIYYFAYKFCENPGLAIIALSFIVNLLVLPLYDRADAMQIAERNIEAKLSKGVEHIKRTFKGDEQLMLLQTYYRQNNYSPTDIIKGSISLFLEIPFFVAAYQFLSHLEILKGVTLGPIKDLGSPDALLTVFGLTINLMPIIMTILNIVSAYIFTKDFPLKTKIQLHGMALFFLVFLYDSPSGLVFYWTLNNLFNLVKTIIYKMDNPKQGTKIALLVCGVLIVLYSIFLVPHPTTRKRFFGILCACLLNSSLVFNVFDKKISIKDHKYDEMNNSRIFYSCGIFMALLTGALIPSSVIESSPQEFVIIDYFQQPLWYVLYSSAVSVGCFLLWFRVFYWLAPNRVKVKFSYSLWIICGIAIVDYMFFGNNLGVLSNTLQYENGLAFSLKEKVVNLIVVVLILFVLHNIWEKFKLHISDIMIISSLSLVCLMMINCISIQKHTKDIFIVNKSGNSSTELFSLSKTGKNVVVIMLDRAIGLYIPYFMNEKPYLKQQFAGFTYYPNTVSFGAFTNFGTPGLFGGYDYIPEEMNKRDQELLMDKHNEALKVMPILFESHGYTVTICDIPYANYEWIPDMSIFNDLSNIHTCITSGMYGNTLRISKEDNPTLTVANNKRNFFCFSIVKCLPVSLQKYFYDNANYNAIQEVSLNQEIKNLSIAHGVNRGFLEKYNVLTQLPKVTGIKEDGNTLLLFVNDTTHEPCMLQLPDYVPSTNVDNSIFNNENDQRFDLHGKRIAMDTVNQVIHYQTNMAAIIQLGKWMDYLRDQGVYDNTRIIIVSDHGRNVKHSKEYILDNKEDIEFYNSLLLIKDFSSKDFHVSDELMTVADVPTIATAEIITDPINPFNGKRISNDYKRSNKIYIFGSHISDVKTNNGNTFKPGPWYSVEKDIRDKNNWKLVKENAVLPY